MTYAETGESDVEGQSDDEEIPLTDLRGKLKNEERRSNVVEKIKKRKAHLREF